MCRVSFHHSTIWNDKVHTRYVFSSVSICPLCFFVMGGQLRWANAFTSRLPLWQLMYMLCISTWQISSLSLSLSLSDCTTGCMSKHCVYCCNAVAPVPLSHQVRTPTELQDLVRERHWVDWTAVAYTMLRQAFRVDFSRRRRMTIVRLSAP